MRVIDIARQVKHAQLVARRRLASALPLDRPRAARDRVYRAADRIRPYSYSDGDFPTSFIAQPSKVRDAKVRPAPGHLFALWTGDNEMSTNRAEALADMRSRLDITLVTPDNLDQWLVAGAPLHPAYEHLSFVHRSDYLRAYLMHHHGGAYLDVKREYGDVPGVVMRLNASREHWIAGFGELTSASVCQEAAPTRAALRRHHGMLIGTSAFAARPDTPLTAEWIAELHSRLDRYAAALAMHPGDAMGDNDGYPIPWTGILGNIFMPLCLKYSERLMADGRIRPSTLGYR